MLTTAFGFGIAAGPLISGALVGIGFAWPFLVVAGMAAVAFVITYSQVYETAPNVVGSPTPADD